MNDEVYMCAYSGIKIDWQILNARTPVIQCVEYGYKKEKERKTKFEMK